MSHRVSAGKPLVTLDGDRVEAVLTHQCNARGWDTDAKFSAGVDALSDAQVLAVVRALLKVAIKVGP